MTPSGRAVNCNKSEIRARVKDYDCEKPCKLQVTNIEACKTSIELEINMDKYQACMSSLTKTPLEAMEAKVF